MTADKVGIPAGLWTRCSSCGHMLYEKEVAEALLKRATEACSRGDYSVGAMYLELPGDPPDRF